MAKQKVSIVRGTSISFAVTVTDEEGETYSLQAGEILRFGIKKTPQDAQYVIEKEATSADADEDGAYIFSFAPSDTANLPITTYSYDVGLQSGADYYNVIEPSDFVVGKNITKWEA